MHDGWMAKWMRAGCVTLWHYNCSDRYFTHTNAQKNFFTNLSNSSPSHSSRDTQQGTLTSGLKPKFLHKTWSPFVFIRFCKFVLQHTSFHLTSSRLLHVHPHLRWPSFFHHGFRLGKDSVKVWVVKLSSCAKMFRMAAFSLRKKK